MDQEKEESKVKYKISKNDNDREVIEITKEKKTVKEKIAPYKKEIAPHKNKILVVCVVMILVIVFLLGHNLRKYQDYNIQSSYDRKDGAESNYIGYNNNLFRYSRDGAFYTTFDGELIWNYTYEMSNPRIDMCADYILLYDEGGTQISILTPTGFKQNIKTSMPIVDAHIAKQGTVAILMQDGGVGHVQLCDVNGKVLAEGVLHMSNSGYPMSIDISDDGENLAVTQLDLGIGNTKTTVAFYNFGSAGKSKENNIVATYSFSNQIIPKIIYMSNGNAVAYGTSEVVLFNNDSKATIKDEYFVEGEIKKVFYDDKYFGYICDATDKNGKLINQINVYSQIGIKRMQKAVDATYTDVSIMSNGEIFLSNGTDVAIYTLKGIEKFKFTFDTSIYNILPQEGSKRYVFIQEGHTNMVSLR